MKCINFDSHFQTYITGWLAVNQGKYKKPEEIEDMLPELYEEWAHRPADWLDGVEPAHYFDSMSDPEELCKLLLKYHRSSIPEPDMLFNRIVALGDASVPTLLDFAADRDLDSEMRISCMNMLGEIQPSGICEKLTRLALTLPDTENGNLLLDAISDCMFSIGSECEAPVIEALTKCPTHIALGLVYAVHHTKDSRIFDRIVKLFDESPKDRSMLASYLADQEDPRGIDVMMPMLEYADLTYLDYIDLRSAIEQLGGEVTTEREFDGDEQYEAYKHMEYMEDLHDMQGEGGHEE